MILIQTASIGNTTVVTEYSPLYLVVSYWSTLVGAAGAVHITNRISSIFAFYVSMQYLGLLRNPIKPSKVFHLQLARLTSFFISIRVSSRTSFSALWPWALAEFGYFESPTQGMHFGGMYALEFSFYQLQPTNSCILSLHKYAYT